MDDRWRCESEGLTRRSNPRTGRTEWVEVNPPCPDGHGEMVPRWMRCLDCSFTCRHWTCRDDGCEREERDPRHVHQGTRKADPHRR